MIGEMVTVKGRNFKVEKFLGKGKSGYSYLISNGEEEYVYKKIHHEPCAYYNFGNKLMAEVWAYENLLKTGINIPEMVEYNEEGGYLVKEYINGKTAAELAVEGSLIEPQFESAFELAGKLYAHKMNVDFFPTNFVYDGTDIFLVDYEFNSYIEEWDLENWGIYFWLNGDGMKEHLEKGFSDKLCLPNSPKPVKDGLEEKAQYLIAKYSRKNR